MSVMTRGLAVLCFCSTLGSGAAAQAAGPTRRGFWIGLGFGYGSARVGCDGCSGDNRSGTTGFLKAGGSLRPNLLIGGEINVWTKSASGLTQAIGNASATISYYPMRLPLFLKGGVGLGLGHFTSTIGGSSSATGIGLLLGAGYDLRIGRNISITPVANLFAGRDGDQKQGSTVLGRNMTHAIWDIGVGITIH